MTSVKNNALKQTVKRFLNLNLTLLLLFQPLLLSAHEGMWVPMLLDRYGQMTAEGLNLSKEDIYSINQDCLKDAVVIFDYGCTGEVVSEKGLVLTNHHCGYDAIQKHSTVDHDYLTNGFWAFSMEEELPNPGMTVTFLRYIEDVTDRVLNGTEDIKDEGERARVVQANIAGLTEKTRSANGYSVDIEALYYGSSYLMFVYEDYRDIRLVGAPPSSIGNFGEDNDNWIWPRHTGDFSIFRIYADAGNKPADYSPDNQPYRPKKFLPLSIKGINEGEFTMVMGYPGSTQQFLISDAVRNMLEISLPQKVKVRTKRLDIMSSYMMKSDTVRIQYASKYRGISNSWKKWQGVILGLDRNRAVAMKEEGEKAFMAWASEYPEREEAYGNVIPAMKDIYGELAGLQLVMDYLGEVVMAPELPAFADGIAKAMEGGKPAAELREAGEKFYRDFYLPIEKETFCALMKYYYDDISEEYYPDFFMDINEGTEKEFADITEKVFKRSRFTSPKTFSTLIDLYEKSPEKAVKLCGKDPIAMVMQEFRTVYLAGLYTRYNVLNKSLAPLYRRYVEGLMKMHDDQVFYPDANFTMRVTFGSAEGYQPADAVEYEYFTTLGGIISKSMEGKKDYLIPDKLKKLYEEGDFGEYGMGTVMPVCFVASNHTSGGNSGSPVMNADGELIGINFDRNWEGTMSDIMYDPQICRNISVDIRYVLFIIDKFAGAGYLLDEMEIRR
ncbi:MAG: S46 family peptidase [Bacteroidota bacterium]